MISKFFKKKLNSDEFILLFKDIEELRVKHESLKLEFAVVRRKLMKKNKLKDWEEEEKDTSKDFKNSVLLPE